MTENRQGRPNTEEDHKRLADAGFVENSEAIKQMADHVLAGSPPHVIVGPVVWDVMTGHDRRHWYFMVGTSDADGKFRLDQFGIGENDRALADECRSGLMMEIIMRRTQIVYHDCDDELQMMLLCEAIWPSDKTRNLRVAIERER